MINPGLLSGSFLKIEKPKNPKNTIVTTPKTTIKTGFENSPCFNAGGFTTNQTPMLTKSKAPESIRYNLFLLNAISVWFWVSNFLVFVDFKTIAL